MKIYNDINEPIEELTKVVHEYADSKYNNPDNLKLNVPGGCHNIIFGDDLCGNFSISGCVKFGTEENNKIENLSIIMRRQVLLNGVEIKILNKELTG